MKKSSFIIATAMLIGMTSFAGAQTEPAPAPEKTEPTAEKTEKAAEAKPMSPEELAKVIGYYCGYSTGFQMASVGPFKVEDLNMDEFIKGLKAGLAGAEAEVPQAVMEKANEQFTQIIMKRIEEASAKSIEEGKKFLEENAKKDGVVTTKSGLQYRVINKGGDKKYEEPKDGDKGTRFKVNYKGTLPNGEVFDESKDGPVEMPLEVIPGFKEALTTMPVGAKWEIVLPSELAYGERGAGGKIGPNQVLVFELELLDILPPDPNQPGPGGMQELTPEQLQELLKQVEQGGGQ